MGAEARESTARCPEARFARWVNDAKIGCENMRKRAAHHLPAWRREVAGAAIVVNPYAAEEERIARERSDSSLERDMTALRAALNHAKDGGAVATDAAWRVALRPVSGVDLSRGLYLDRKQRAKLIEQAPADLDALLRGLALVPLRPGALAALTVGSPNRRLSALTVGVDKAGADRRMVLPAATTAYNLRHSVISDLVGAGPDVPIVARLSGTSVAMIERHHGHGDESR